MLENFKTKIQPFIEMGHVVARQFDDLTIYDYTNACVYARGWNDLTMMCRGLIMNDQDEVVAKPFPKFFNLGEQESTLLHNLDLSQPYQIYEKLDGSLGILYRHAGQHKIATRGAFHSRQALWATEQLVQHDLTHLNDNVTLLFEIIYPENHIIVDYQDRAELVLIGAYDRVSGIEFAWDAVEQFGQQHGFALCKHYQDFSLETCLALQKTMSNDQEGFVIRFANGTRVKLKGEVYRKLQLLLSSLSPVAVWKTMQNGIVPHVYKIQIPEELRYVLDPLVQALENKYATLWHEIQTVYESVSQIQDRKQFALEVLAKHKPLSDALFGLRQNQRDSVERFIMDKIYPKGNVLV